MLTNEKKLQRKFTHITSDHFNAMKNKRYGAILNHIIHLENIKKNRICQFSFAADVNMPPSTLSKLLKVLREKKLIIITKDDTKKKVVCTYNINYPTLNDLLDEMDKFKYRRDKIHFIDEYFGETTYKSLEKGFQKFTEEIKEVEDNEVINDIPTVPTEQIAIAASAEKDEVDLLTEELFNPTSNLKQNKADLKPSNQEVEEVIAQEEKPFKSKENDWNKIVKDFNDLPTSFDFKIKWGADIGNCMKECESKFLYEITSEEWDSMMNNFPEDVLIFKKFLNTIGMKIKN